MKAVVQRVSEGAVFVSEANYSKVIRTGLVILLGIKTGDTVDDAVYLAEKCCSLRIFNDGKDKMNLSVKDINGEVLIISQFTLYGETERGNRPSYISAAKPDDAISLYEKFIESIKNILGENKVRSGIFGAMMSVKIINDGPVTIIIESKKNK